MKPVLILFYTVGNICLALPYAIIRKEDIVVGKEKYITIFDLIMTIIFPIWTGGLFLFLLADSNEIIFEKLKKPLFKKNRR